MLNALGALEGAEREDLRAQLALPEAAVLSDVATFNDLAALMAIASTAPHEPSPTLKEKVLQRIAPHRSGGAINEQSTDVLSGFKFIFNAEQGDWHALRVPGASVKLLSVDATRGYAVVLGKLEAGARYPAHRHIHGEQVYILSGDLHIGEKRLGPGDFHHADAGTAHGVNYSETGCVILAVISTADLEAQMA